MIRNRLDKENWNCMSERQPWLSKNGCNVITADTLALAA